MAWYGFMKFGCGFCISLTCRDERNLFSATNTELQLLYKSWWQAVLRNRRDRWRSEIGWWCSEIIEIDGARQRGFVLAFQRFEDLIIGVAAE